MQVVNRLAAILAVINDNTEALSQVLLYCDLPGDSQEAAKQCLVLILRPGQLGNGLLGNHQEMNWGLRAHIAKGKAQVILVQDLEGS